MLTYKHTKYTCYLSYIASAVINNLAPLLFFTFRNEFGLSVIQLGFLVTLNFFIQIIVDYIGAMFATAIGYRQVAMAGHGFIFAGLMMLGTLPYIMPAYPGICISVATYAIGSGLIEVMVSPIVESLPETGKKASMSFLHSFYCWGQMGVVLVSTLYFRTAGIEYWRYLCYIWAIIPLVGFMLFSKVPITQFEADANHSGILKLFKNKTVLLFLIIMLCSGASELSVAQWASYFAESGLKVSKTVGDLLGACLFALFMGASRVLYGMYAEKIKLTRVITLSSILCVISYLIISLSPNPFISLLGCGLCGFSVGVMWPGTLSLAANTVPGGGTPMFGILALMGDAGCSAGPTLVSTVSAHIAINGDGMKAGILVSGIFPLIIAVILVASRKKLRDM